MADKPKVVAEVESREVTIDQRSGVDEITVTLTERRHWVRFCPTGRREARAC